MKYVIAIAILVSSITFSGCAMMPGKSEFSCKSKDLKNAGVCKNSMWILKNKDLLNNRNRKCIK